MRTLRSTAERSDRQRPTVAITLWGDLFEDFFDTVGVSVERFRTDVTGGWIFGYVEALDRVGVDCLLVFASARVRRPQRFVHQPTGARVSILPAPRRHALLRRVRSAWTRVSPVGGKALGSVASYASLPLLAFARELRLAGVEVLLSQDYEHARFDVLVALGWLTGRPVHASFQGGTAPFSRLEAPVRRRTVRRCRGFIVAAGQERERLQREYGVEPERIAPIPNALDLSRHGLVERAEARRRLGIPPTALVVEWHGRIAIHRKGLDVLIDAWDRVCRDRPGAELLLLLVGSGPDDEEFRRRLSVLEPSSVRWVDEYVNEREVLDTYPSAADVYVFPSRHEGFPVAPVEAMAGGLPIVACDASGVPDILGTGEASGGLLVPRDDPAALAAALGRLLDDPRYARELGDNARRTAEARFSLEAVGAQLRGVLLDEPARTTASPRAGLDRTERP